MGFRTQLDTDPFERSGISCWALSFSVPNINLQPTNTIQ